MVTLSACFSADKEGPNGVTTDTSVTYVPDRTEKDSAFQVDAESVESAVGGGEEDSAVGYRYAS